MNTGVGSIIRPLTQSSKRKCGNNCKLKESVWRGVGRTHPQLSIWAADALSPDRDRNEYLKQRAMLRLQLRVSTWPTQTTEGGAREPRVMIGVIQSAMPSLSQWVPGYLK